MNTAHPELRDAVLVSEQVQSTGDGSAGASVLYISLSDIRAPVYRLKTMAMLSAMGHIQNGCIGPEKDCATVAKGLNVTQSDRPVRDIGAPTSTPDGTCTVLDGATAALTQELPTPTPPAETVGDQNSGEGMHEASPVRDSSASVDQKPESLPSVTTSVPSDGDSLAVVTVPSHAPVPATVLLASSDDSGTFAPETLTLTLTLNAISEGNARAIGQVPEIERGNKRLHDDVSPEISTGTSRSESMEPTGGVHTSSFTSTDGVSSVANDKSQSEPSAALECTATSVAEPAEEPVRKAIRKINQTAKTPVDDTAIKPGGSATEFKKQPKKIAVHKTKKEIVATQGKRTGGKITMATVTMAKGEGVKHSYMRKEMDQDSAAKALDASETVVSKKPFKRTDKPAVATDRDIDLSAEYGEGSSTNAQTTAHEQKKVAPGKKLTKKELALKKPTEREVLPFPIYYGLDILCTQEAFTLPYDVYCASQSHALAPRAVPPPPYKKINRIVRHSGDVTTRQDLWYFAMLLLSFSQCTGYITLE
ncbi:hypothetical protein SARC_05942 [Sphaeroforma arctica JP610]|uniref:Uncharacterized protein n=1 Tax=Sphaeroforma arctica JP610 TaxID=667725 RepID=A0A0L0G0M3_9EUKA|nr:hypothetical protein SARC_05942 [Sphaeroforma arctica JP610]KNC81758.1 hypothetical protein SARC_05942 [Sphaeroforma arctica JP610]|eukprot:XP_014155660.1 hypothetical protein SARC_05942 [Sphaeroforma arctica JP610]